MDVAASVAVSAAFGPSGVLRRVDHVAIAVSNMEAGIEQIQAQLELKMVRDEALTEAGVRVVYFDAGNTMLQLITPLRPGKVSEHLATHGDGLHHVCFAVDDIDDALRCIPGAGEESIFVGGFGRRACFLERTACGASMELMEVPVPGGEGTVVEV